MDKFTINDLEKAIKFDKRTRDAYKKVSEFEEWLSYQGKLLKDEINNKKNG